MLTSLFENNINESIHIYVLQQDLTQKDKEILFGLVSAYHQRINFLDVDRTRFEAVPTSIKFSIETYFRLGMHELLPKDITRVLYLDVDIIVCGSIHELYQTEFEGNYFIVCNDLNLYELDEYRRQHFNRYDDLRYFNAGVMLWNLEELRGKYFLEDYMKAAKELNYELPFVDQDLLNYMMYDKVKYIDPLKYNYMTNYESDKGMNVSDFEPVIIHYAGCNPWQIGAKTETYKLWWKYAKTTPFYVDLLEEQLERVECAGTLADHELKKNMDMAEIFRLMYELKGTGKTANAMDETDCEYILYGAGYMAESFWRFVCDENVINKPVQIIDKNKTGDFHDIEIMQEFHDMTFEKSFQIIVTPSYRTELIISQLQREVPDKIRITSLAMFLNEIFYSS